MLSVSGLINYMGKIDLPLNDAEAQDNGISIKPILLRKGKTKLALYGVGNVKDTRMHFELRSNRVHMFMPKDKDDWFNVFLLHQNRSGSFLIRPFQSHRSLSPIEYLMDHNNRFQKGCSITVLTLWCGGMSTTVA